MNYKMILIACALFYLVSLVCLAVGFYKNGQESAYKEYARHSIGVDADKVDPVIMLSLWLNKKGFVVVPREQWDDMQKRR